jgi:hypothetical protein
VTFVKGQSGCPTGRGGAGKGEFTRALMQALYERADAKPRPLGDYKKIDRIVQALISKGLEGDVPAIREIAERIEGRVPTPIVDQEGNTPMLLVVRWGSKDRIANDDALPLLELKANGHSD